MYCDTFGLALENGPPPTGPLRNLVRRPAAPGEYNSDTQSTYTQRSSAFAEGTDAATSSDRGNGPFDISNLRPMSDAQGSDHIFL